MCIHTQRKPNCDSIIERCCIPSSSLSQISLSSLSMGGAITQSLPLRCVGQVLCPPLRVQAHPACLPTPLHLLPAPPFLQEPRSVTSHGGSRAMGQAGPSWSQMVAWKHRRTSGPAASGHLPVLLGLRVELPRWLLFLGLP